MATILITGGTGLIGSRLQQLLLAKGHQVIIVSRDVERKSDHPGLRYAYWDVHHGKMDTWAIAAADCIVHLAGAGVADKRWSAARKKEILDSRVNSSRLLGNILRTVSNNVKAFISASATGWYGPDPVVPNPSPFHEEMPAATDFLGSVCRQWEQSVDEAAGDRRVVKLRTGIVWSKDGGAIPELKKSLKWGIAAIPGNGTQVMSWIHLDDLVRLYVRAIEDNDMEGVFNAVTPYPVSYNVLLNELVRTHARFAIRAHIPSWLMKLVLGEMSIEVLKSATVSAEKLLEHGFAFELPDVSSAIRMV